MIKSSDYLKSSLTNIEKYIFLFNNFSCKIPQQSKWLNS